MRGTPISPPSATNGAKVRERCFATCPSCGGDVVGRMDTFIITCEHGGNRIPAPYRRLFREQRALLDSHRGYDPGSLVMATALARACRAPLVASTVSRLLIALNRSIGHPQLFSAMTRAAPAQTWAQHVERLDRPPRMHVERPVEHAVARGQRVMHISSHSFTAE